MRISDWSSDVCSSDLTLAAPLRPAAGLTVLRGNLFDNAVMKLSVISPAFRERYLSNAADPDAFEGVAVVFDGPEDYHSRIDDQALGADANSILKIGRES